MKVFFYEDNFRSFSNFAILRVEICKYEVMEQNGLQIRNQRTNISLERYDTSMHQKILIFC